MDFRVARHTNDLKKIKHFYTNVLNFEILGEFENHSNYNGVFIGLKDLNWHLEFTQSNEKVNHFFNEDDALVFYPKTEIQYHTILKNITEQRITILKAKNPYWNTNGTLIQDPDGYCVIISALKIVTKNNQY